MQHATRISRQLFRFQFFPLQLLFPTFPRCSHASKMYYCSDLEYKRRKKNNQTTRSFVGNFVAKSLHSFICKFTWTMNEIQKLILLLRFRSRIENRESESVYNLNCKNELVSFEMRLMKSDQKKKTLCAFQKSEMKWKRYFMDQDKLISQFIREGFDSYANKVSTIWLH